MNTTITLQNPRELTDKSNLQVVRSGKTATGYSIHEDLRRRLERFLFVPPTQVAYAVMKQYGRRPETCAAGLVSSGLEKHCVSTVMLRECRTIEEVHAMAELLGLEADFVFKRRTDA